MGPDVGDKNIGVAISDALLLTAFTALRTTVRRKELKSDLEILRRLVEENEVGSEIVKVGQPLHMNGKTSPQSEKVARFADQLQKVLGLPDCVLG